MYIQTGVVSHTVQPYQKHILRKQEKLKVGKKTSLDKNNNKKFNRPPQDITLIFLYYFINLEFSSHIPAGIV